MDGRKQMDNARLCQDEQHVNSTQMSSMPAAQGVIGDVEQLRFTSSASPLDGVQSSIGQRNISSQNTNSELKFNPASKERVSTDVFATEFMSTTVLAAGHFHQATMGEPQNRHNCAFVHKRQSRGLQCVANSMAALAKAKLTNILLWSTEDVNTILCHGDKLYEAVSAVPRQLFIEDIPHIFQTYGISFEMTIGAELHSGVRATDIDKVLRECSTRTDFTGILMLGDMTGSAAVAVSLVNGEICMFDSHARHSRTGFVDSNGVAVCLKFPNTITCALYLKELAKQLNATQLTVTEVRLDYHASNRRMNVHVEKENIVTGPNLGNRLRIQEEQLDKAREQLKKKRNEAMHLWMQMQSCASRKRFNSLKESHDESCRAVQKLCEVVARMNTTISELRREGQHKKKGYSNVDKKQTHSTQDCTFTPASKRTASGLCSRLSDVEYKLHLQRTQLQLAKQKKTHEEQRLNFIRQKLDRSMNSEQYSTNEEYIAVKKHIHLMERTMTRMQEQITELSGEEKSIKDKLNEVRKKEMSPEKKKEGLLRRNFLLKEKRLRQQEEEREEYLKRRRTNEKKARQAETPEQKKHRLEKRRHSKTQREKRQTPQKRQQDKEKMRQTDMSKRQHQTPEKHERRKQQMKEYSSKSRLGEIISTPGKRRKRDNDNPQETDIGTYPTHCKQRFDFEIQGKHQENIPHKGNDQSRDIPILTHEQMSQHVQAANEDIEAIQHNSRQDWETCDIRHARNLFQKEIQKTPTYVCASCNRLMWKESGKNLNLTNYTTHGDIAEKVFTTARITLSETLSPSGKAFVCSACHKSVKNGNIPAMAKANGLELDEIPDELKDLNELEVRLISQRLLFMCLRDLPKGRQRGMKGPAVNVPAKLAPILKLLPRTPQNAQLLTVSLKRKITYKHAYMKDTIRPQRVKEALLWLCQNNHLYADVQINENWITEWETTDTEFFNKVFENDEQEVPDDVTSETLQSSSDAQKPDKLSGRSQQTSSLGNSCGTQVEQNTDDNEEEPDAHAEQMTKLRGLAYNTTIQNESTQEIVRQYSVAPGEGERPKPILTDTHMEELAYPDKFPFGRGTFNNPIVKRATKLSLAKYCRARLLDVDGRFARDVNYIFAQQYATEHQNVSSTIGIALRQTRGQGILRAGQVQSSEQIQNFCRRDTAYRFLKDIRGSPPYWQTMFYDCLAFIRALGIGTFFLTLSAADMRWPEVIQSIAAQYGVKYTVDEVKNLPWLTRSKWLRSNPVTAARMFEHRTNTLVKKFLQHRAQPLGLLVDYVIRVEFQQRGSPHVHCILWIKDAPILGCSSEEDVIAFIDKYITCDLPTDDDELKELVMQLQTHVCNPQCCASGKCRYKYPRPPSYNTLITHELESEEQEAELRECQNVLKKFQETMEEMDIDDNTTIDDILKNANIDKTDYIKYLSMSHSGNSIILKRKPQETRINNYNPAVLTTWQANMDIQFIVNAYACVMYVASYVMKAEKNLSELLKNAARQLNDEIIRDRLRALGSVLLTHRELCAQEANYRVLGLNLRKASRATVVLSTDVPEKRVRLLLPQATLAKLDEDDPNIFCTNILDRYAARPTSVEHLCLADFASLYHLGTADKSDSTCIHSEQNLDDEREQDDIHATGDGNENLSDDTDDTLPKTLKLPQPLGTMTKRRRRSIVRWHNVSRIKDPENYYRIQLLLFFPWHDENSILGNCDSYKERYEHKEELIKVAQRRHIHVQETLDDNVVNLLSSAQPESAWDMLAPGAREEEIAPLSYEDERPMDQADLDANAAHIVSAQTKTSKYRSQIDQSKMSHADYIAHWRSLNAEQQAVVSHHRQWCKNAAAHVNRHRSNEIKPYFLFLSGPGGVGKSYVIKMLQHDTLYYFNLCRAIPADDVVSMLTATTGVAAHNISGVTVHKAFYLSENIRRRKTTPRGVRQIAGNYVPLSSGTLNTMRTDMENLHVVIIDEVSMMSARMLYHLHYRLQDLKGYSGDDTRFGNVTIIAVGDLYQLPPCFGGKIFDLPSSTRNPTDLCILHEQLWKENFQLHELKTVVRQRDAAFAAVLNNVRTNTLSDADVLTLKSREIQMSDPDHFVDALHVFATNQEADVMNNDKLNTLQTQQYNIPCVDSKVDRQTGQVPVKTRSGKRSETGGLLSVLNIAENARIKLVANLDVTDGLVNGALGTVVRIITKDDTDKVQLILVKFDSDRIGLQAQADNKFRTTYPGTVPIVRFTAPFGSQAAMYIRCQFPLILAWASTVHTVQGLSLDKIVVDMKKIFAPGQAYVALSRVRSIQGLQIMNFNTNVIKCDKSVEEEMKRLRQKTLTFPINHINEEQHISSLKIAHLNINGLLTSLHDITNDENVSKCDIVCLTETHLNNAHTLPDHFLWTDSKTYRKDRHGNIQKGGVLIACKSDIVSTQCMVNTGALEAMAIRISTSRNIDLVILVVYRRSQVVTQEQCANIVKNIFSNISLPPERIIILGDFNDPDDGVISRALNNIGLTQRVKKPTCDTGSTIDHIYVHQSVEQVLIDVIDTYYSDHDLTILLHHPENGTQCR